MFFVNCDESYGKVCQPKSRKIVNNINEAATIDRTVAETVNKKNSIISECYLNMFTNYTEFLTYKLYIEG